VALGYGVQGTATRIALPALLLGWARREDHRDEGRTAPTCEAVGQLASRPSGDRVCL